MKTMSPEPSTGGTTGGSTAATCATCRGWSCMACVAAKEHDVCVLDCPDCYDLRMASAEPWDRRHGLDVSADAGSPTPTADLTSASVPTRRVIGRVLER